ncbi:MAG: hypothetical protein QXO27_03215 [Candidatus Aenigmatarchaeota archaeon]
MYNYSNIEHHYNQTIIKIIKPIVELDIKLNFKDVKFDGLEAVSSIDKPKAIFPHHWSYWDTILLPYSLFIYGKRSLISAGNNLPLQFIMKLFGAFEVPRSFNRNRECIEEWKNIRDYITSQLINKENMIFFFCFFHDGKEIKTGRSKDGCHQQIGSIPFKAIEKAYSAGVESYIIPVNEIYERVPEDRRIFAFDNHKDKLPTLINKTKYFLDMSKTFMPKMKKHSALILYGEPQSYSELRNRMNVEQIRRYTEEKIKNLYRPTSLDIFAMAVYLQDEDIRYDRRNIANVEETIIDYFKKQGVKTFEVPKDTRDLEEKVQEIAPDIFRFNHDYVEVKDKRLLQFYTNRILHFF